MTEKHHQDSLAQSDDMRFYLTSAHDCAYLENQQARSLVLDAAHTVSIEEYNLLVQHGFRRSGHYVYRPHCDQCRACVPLRIPVLAFTPNRVQQRIWRRHQNLFVEELPLSFDQQHFELYQRYTTARHPDSLESLVQTGELPEEAYSNFLLASSVNTRLLTFKDQQGRLLMVSVVDVLADGLSAVYTFYEPEIPKASFGTYNILWQIECAKRLGFEFVYLGYWIAESQKMAYKANFQPSEILLAHQWQKK